MNRDGADTLAYCVSRMSPEDVSGLYEAFTGEDFEVRPHPGRVIELRGEAVDPKVGTPTELVEHRVDGAPEIGWLENPDGTVNLGCVAPVLSATVLQVLVALETDVSVTDHGTILIHDLQAGTAEAAVRILAPLGVSFDAAAWLSP